jgi:glycosyltransferase involved in cell wall biosynthesis
MPFYNQADFLVESVNSVICQTYGNYELIVVDDCSNQGSACDLLQKHSLLSDQLTIIRHEQNLGVSVARNTGVAQSKGELILPLDADDLITPDFLAKTIELTFDAAVSGVYTSVREFGQTNVVWHPQCTIESLLLGDGSPATMLYRRSLFDLVGGYKAHIDAGENSEFLLSALEHGAQFKHLREPLFQYRRHRLSKTCSPDFVPRAVRHLVRAHRQLARAHFEQVFIEQNQRCIDIEQNYDQLHAECTAIYKGLLARDSGR